MSFRSTSDLLTGFLTELLGFLTNLGLLKTLIYPRLSTECGMMVFFTVVLDGKSSQEYPVNAAVPQGSILGPTLFLLYINDLPDNVTCNIAIYAYDATLYCKCDQASDLWQQLELASELESDL